MQTCRVLTNTTKVLRVTHLVPVLVARDQGKFEEREDFDQYIQYLNDAHNENTELIHNSAK